MTWARKLHGPMRAIAARAFHWSKEFGREVGMIGPDDPIGKRFLSFGKRSFLAYPQGAFYNEHYISIGEDTMVGPYACITAGMAPGQEMPSSPVVKIGDRCIIGRGSHIIGHWSVEIEDDIQTGPYVYITDQNHVYENPEEPIGRQWPVESAVRIGKGSWLGANVIVLPGANIGENVVVAAGAVVRGHIPDRCVIAGVPAKIVRRHVEGSGWQNIDGSEL